MNELIIQIGKEELLTNIDYINENRWKKVRLLGQQNPVSQYKFNQINELLDSYENVYVLHGTTQKNPFYFGFELMLKYISPDNMGKIQWIDDISRSTKYSYKDPQIPTIYSYDSSRVTLSSMEGELTEYTRVHETVKPHYRDKQRWKTLQYLVWTLLHDIDNKEAVYKRHPEILSEDLMHFKSNPYWEYEIITIHKSMGGDKLTNCCDYNSEIIIIDRLSNAFEWIWDIAIQSEFKIIPLHINFSFTVMLIHKSLNKNKVLKELKDSMDKRPKINREGCW